MADFQIKHDRPNCISCGACAAIAPEYWYMGEDGKSDIKNATTTPEGWEELDVKQEEYAKNKEAADACPVNVIHIVDKKTGQQII